jgi:hypothetical protein
MSGRIYRVPMNQLAMSASTQEMWAITASSTIPFWLEEIRLDPFQATVAEFLLSLSLFTSTFSAGSGGTSVTPAKDLFNDIAAGATAAIGNTTRTAVGTGAKSVKDAGNWNSVNGWVWQPIDSDHRIAVPMSACIALSLDTTGVSATINGCAIIREMF